MSPRLHHLGFHGGIHVQSLLSNYTLVTQISNGSSCFTIGPLRGVPDTVYSAFLTSLDLQFRDVTVKSRSNATLADLVAFVVRQKNLASLPRIPSKIAHLSTFTCYIPHLLPFTPHVQRIYLCFPDGRDASAGRDTAHVDR
ncbi:hypothetical protein FB45DRAFT_1053292 [Roridomyces roridus]|uniref:Uncharacterized protein n=1 Tax=Roridomyces roridus TaxID=1738132 RepID=A0AAD7CBS5_9AGAR|nr:hypothetical protein FB45DRAFT_1053292 [Roridomyces roridus]